jgi:3-phytase
LLLADDGASNYKIANVAGLLDGLGIPRGRPAGVGVPANPSFPGVRARFETPAVPSPGDAADDPAVWVHPSRPSESLIVGTDKRAGLNLYDAQGRLLQAVPDGKMNNVDLREGFRLGGRNVVLVTASDRSHGTIAIYVLDTDARRLVNVADGPQPANLSDPYGQCMYVSRRTGRSYVFISDPDGLVRQWELIATPEGRVRSRVVRDLRFSSQTEGCIADDETGRLFVAEEDVGLWRVSAEPGGREDRRMVASIAANSSLSADLEGLGIYDLGGGRGYIVASSQGNNSYAVFRREGDHAYLGSYAVVGDGASGIDGISETDGLTVTSGNLGPGLESGAMIAQDGRNVLPAENQNFKIVSWQDIARALNLEIRR